MSDEPSDAQKLIAEVMVTHALVYDDWAVVDADFYTCACGWHLSTSASVHDHAAHVAAEVDKALGGLTREEQWTPITENGDRWKPRTRENAERDLLAETRENLDAHGLTDFAAVVAIEGESRWVSGWTVTE